MILYFAGGGSPWLPEMQLDPPPPVLITVWQYTDVDNTRRKPGVWRPDGRLLPVLIDRRARRKKQGLTHPPFKPKRS